MSLKKIKIFQKKKRRTSKFTKKKKKTQKKEKGKENEDFDIYSLN